MDVDGEKFLLINAHLDPSDAFKFSIDVEHLRMVMGESDKPIVIGLDANATSGDFRERFGHSDLIGEFTSSGGDRSRVLDFLRLVHEFDIVLLNTFSEPIITKLNNNGRDLQIDFFGVSSPLRSRSSAKRWDMIPGNDSDHYPLRGQIKFGPQPRRLRPMRQWSSFRWQMKDADFPAKI